MGPEHQSQNRLISLPTPVWSIQENGENLGTTHNDRTVEMQVYARKPQDQSRLVEGPNF